MRDGCRPCLSKAITLKWKPCWKRSCNYMVECHRCKEEGITSVYHGESCKSIQRRALGHVSKLRGWDSSSFMLRHNLLCHPDGDPQNEDYLWSITQQYNKPLARAVDEAIRIKQAYEKETETCKSMNAKMEFTRNTLPGITRAASDADKKENEELRKKISILKLEADKGRRQKGNRRLQRERRNWTGRKQRGRRKGRNQRSP